MLTARFLLYRFELYIELRRIPLSSLKTHGLFVSKPCVFKFVLLMLMIKINIYDEPASPSLHMDVRNMYREKGPVSKRS